MILSLSKDREIVHCESKEHWLSERAKDIASTDSPALFGLSPYKTALSLYNEKANGLYEAWEGNEFTKWGERLQGPIAAGIAEDNGFRIEPFTNYVRMKDERIGSSFDYLIVEPDTGLLEIKNVGKDAFASGWHVDGDEIEAPPWIEMQVQHQLLVSGLKFAYIGALIGGNKPILIRREVDPEITEAIRKRVAQFWQDVENKRAPEPDFELDAEFLASLVKQTTKETYVAENNPDVLGLVRRYMEVHGAHTKLGEERDALRAEILFKVGDVGRIIAPECTISCGMTKDSFIEAHTRSGSRQFRLNRRKEK